MSQDVLTLLVFECPRCLRLDLLTQLENLDLPVQELVHELGPTSDVQFAQDLLTFLEIQIQLGPDEVDTLFQNGRSADHYPEEWGAYVDYIRRSSQDWDREQHNIVGAYQDRLNDPDQRMDAAKAFVTM